MKETTIFLTNARFEQLEAEGRRQGLPTDVLIRLAVDDFLDLNGATSSDGPDELGDPSVQENKPGVENPPSQLWFVGIAQGDDSDNPTQNTDRILAKDWVEYIIEDCFGGTRSSDLSNRIHEPSESVVDDRPQSQR